MTEKIVAGNIFSSLFRNIFSIFILQVLNMLAPLIVLPIISRALSQNEFGMFMIALSISGILLVICDFGFNLYATREVSKNKNDSDKINTIFSSVVYIKILLLTICMCILFLISKSGVINVTNVNYYLFIGLNVITLSMIPVWYFQGVEKMKFVTTSIFFSKIAYVLFIVFSVDFNSSSIDLLLYTAVSNVVSLLIITYVLIKHQVKLVKVKLNLIFSFAKQSSFFFYSRVAVSLFSISSGFIIGVSTGAVQAALYGACEKIFLATQSVTTSLVQGLYPYMSRTNDKETLRKYVFVFGFLVIFGCIVIQFFTSEILTLIYGESYADASSILSVFLLVTVINFFSANFGYPAFSKDGLVNLANKTVIYGAMLHITLLGLVYLLDELSATNVAITVLISELSILVSRIYLLKKHTKFFEIN